MRKKEVRQAPSIKEQTKTMQIGDSLQVHVLPNPDHVFLMGTMDVALGYGVSDGTVRKHLERNRDDFKEGTHFVKGATISHGLMDVMPHTTYWTKAGVVRLGFFVKSDRGKMFRDWAEKVIMDKLTAPKVVLPPVAKRKHNRLNVNRLLDIMADVCRIEDNELRISIASKLMQS